MSEPHNPMQEPTPHPQPQFYQPPQSQSVYPQHTYPQHTYSQHTPYPTWSAYQQPTFWHYPQPLYQPMYQPYQQPILSITQSPPAQSYKKMVQRTALFVALALIVFYVINVSTAILMMLGDMLLSGELASLVSSAQETLPSVYPSEQTPDTTEQNPMLGIIGIVGIILGALAFFILRGKHLVTTDLTRTDARMKVKELLIMACLIMGIQAFFVLAQTGWEGLLESVGISPLEETDPFLQMMNLSGILYIVLIGPIVEEIMFRGAIMRALQPYGQNFAILVSSLLFGVYHLVFLQGMFAFFVGLVLAYCAMRFSIKWAMLLHIMNNSISVALTYFNVSDLMVLGIMCIQLSLGLIALFPAFSRYKAQLKIGKPSSVAIVSKTTTGPWAEIAAAVRPRPYAMTFSSPLLIVGFCLATLIMFGLPMIQ